MISMPSFRCSFLIQNQALLPRRGNKAWFWMWNAMDSLQQIGEVSRLIRWGLADAGSGKVWKAWDGHNWIHLYKHIPSKVYAPCHPKEAPKFRLDKISWIDAWWCMHAGHWVAWPHKRHVPNYLCNLPRVPKLRLEKAAPARLSWFTATKCCRSWQSNRLQYCMSMICVFLPYIIL